MQYLFLSFFSKSCFAPVACCLHYVRLVCSSLADQPHSAHDSASGWVTAATSLRSGWGVGITQRTEQVGCDFSRIT